MHVLIVTDQHAESLGGVQVSIRVQRRFLEAAGHTVSVAAPALHRAHAAGGDPGTLDLPSRPITRDREYGISWPGRRSDRALAGALRSRPPVDLVHVQGDFWGAMIGYRAASGLGVPVVHTMHNNVDEGTRAVSRLAPLAFQALRGWRRLALGPAAGPIDPRARGAWRFLAELSAGAARITAPSAHFAAELAAHGVRADIAVTATGVDDDAVATVLAERAAAGADAARAERARPRLVWLGRMSQEKRILEFLTAVADARLDADIALYGAGLLLPRVERLIAERGLADRVTIPGPVPYPAALAAMADADALVQTSLGFETQGMTPFEAAALGTPTVFSDPKIAADVGVAPAWLAADGSVAALAAALTGAVAELAAAPGQLRVPAAEAARLTQSAQTERMLAVYAAALAG